MTYSSKNLISHLTQESPDKNIFGQFEDPDERLINKIEYANHKYLEFKQKMRYVYKITIT